MSDGIECIDVTLVRAKPDAGERSVLRGVSAHFPMASMSLICGAVGSGKSTLLHILALLLRPTSGEVLADGEAVSRFAGNHRDRWRRRAGIAMQSPQLLGDLTALENVMAPLIPTPVSLRDAASAGRGALARVGAESLATRAAAELSGGEKARVALARALVARPDFLYVDEPTAHQDADAAAMILTLLSEERERGAMVLVVSHDARVRESPLLDRVVRLDDGLAEVER